ncbi:hypothetical protein QO259_09975 [Salinicola sp. JS01]|uniref:hypothetical protein n=1 Tax=Salinicola sp. JS01 TaxID=3050071 RepID=UPI00255B61A7|nr:hypothetical protein [Salinicola sp. JS01]WIX34939.1 hypothetical protein QO259_09975 [Salinicola sp. JS01]
MKRTIATMVAIAALGSALAGCDSDLEKEAKKAVANQLRDPDSAKFRNVVGGQGVNHSDTVCGEVNGKNGFGAYVGYRKFIYYPDGTLSISSGQPIQFMLEYMEECPSKFWPAVRS